MAADGRVKRKDIVIPECISCRIGANCFLAEAHKRPCRCHSCSRQLASPPPHLAVSSPDLL